MSGFEIFGVVAAVLPLITDGLPKIMQALETYRNADVIKEESLETVSGLFTELRVTFAILQQLNHQYPRIPYGAHRVFGEFKSMFKVFPKIVKRLRKECESLTKDSNIRFLLSRHRLEEAIQELEVHMQRLFRRLTLLVTYLQRVIPSPDYRWAIQYSSGPQDRGLRRPPQIRELLKAQHSQPRSIGSGARFAHPEFQVGDFAIQYYMDNWVVVETCTFEGRENVIRGEKASQEVVQKLTIDSSSDRLGILACHAAQWIARDIAGSLAQLTLIYRYPAMAKPSAAPRTLRSVLRHDDDNNIPRIQDMPLRVRLRLAREISNAVLFVHVANLVHKDIRPENILIFTPRYRASESTKYDEMGKAFLTGFGESRTELNHNADNSGPGHPYTVYEANIVDRRKRPSHEGTRTKTTVFRANSWYQSIYHHPSRVGPTPTGFTMLHDIYALGVTLFEIGLWRSFVGSEGHVASSGQYPITYRSRKPLWVFKGKIPVSERAMQSTLLVAARQLLPCAMGETYTSIVLSCLTCLEKDPNRLGPDEGTCAMFIENVLDRLDDIKM